MKPGDVAYFLLRVRRRGPLVPARIRLIDHAPEDPEWNKLDRGRLSSLLAADIAGEEIDPQIMLDRLISCHDWFPANLPGHWRYAQAITEAEYRYRVAHREWIASVRPSDPIVRPREAAEPAQLALPVFEDD